LEQVLDCLPLFVTHVFGGIGVNEQQIFRKTFSLSNNVSIFSEGQAVAVKEEVVVASDEIIDEALGVSA
jgi:hypothetical protein